MGWMSKQLIILSRADNKIASASLTDEDADAMTLPITAAIDNEVYFIWTVLLQLDCLLLLMLDNLRLLLYSLI